MVGSSTGPAVTSDDEMVRDEDEEFSDLSPSHAVRRDTSKRVPRIKQKIGAKLLLILVNGLRDS
jgi:hypothetical protein